MCRASLTGAHRAGTPVAGGGAAADYTHIANDGQVARLQGYLDDATQRGLQTVRLAEVTGERAMAPTLVLDPPDDAAVMQEEIFGPILPIKSYRALDEAIDFVAARDRPLALHPFSRDHARIERILQRTLAGGVAVDETLLHFASSAPPFGGIGASGMGAYHGRAGFDAMSKALPILWQRRLAASDLLKPPYARIDRLIRRLVR